MKDNRMGNIEKLFIENHGYATTAQLLKIGADSRLILNLIKINKAVKIKPGLYKWSSYTFESQEEMVDLARAVPNGVFCLFTALAYYDLSTYNPSKFSMAIYRDLKKPILPDFPPVKIFYFSEKQYRTGVSTIQIEGSTVKIYDIEKTICDCVRYRNKIGLDIMQETLRAYMTKKNRNLEKLWQYSETLNIKTVIKPFLEALT